MKKRISMLYIPYHPSTKTFARELRKNMTPAEKILWNQVLSRRRMEGFKFLRQKPFGNFILDFYCRKILLCIEIDGEYHKSRKEYDAERTMFLSQYAITILRFSNSQIYHELPLVRQKIQKVCRKKLITPKSSIQPGL
jgi:very-short-patch-repair endonuclease